ncbi:UNVERIFIED_CONTAM: hypothetical protein K2H54_061390 [Gekko kuhli]
MDVVAGGFTVLADLYHQVQQLTQVIAHLQQQQLQQQVTAAAIMLPNCLPTDMVKIFCKNLIQQHDFCLNGKLRPWFLKSSF